MCYKCNGFPALCSFKEYNLQIFYHFAIICWTVLYNLAGKPELRRFYSSSETGKTLVSSTWVTSFLYIHYFSTRGSICTDSGWQIGADISVNASSLTVCVCVFFCLHCAANVTSFLNDWNINEQTETAQPGWRRQQAAALPSVLSLDFWRIRINRELDRSRSNRRKTRRRLKFPVGRAFCCNTRRELWLFIILTLWTRLGFSHSLALICVFFVSTHSVASWRLHTRVYIWSV